MISKEFKSELYGGDKVNLKDEESVRLFLKECHRQQENLYDVKSDSSCCTAIFACISNPANNLIVSGQSRIRLSFLYDRDTDILNEFKKYSNANNNALPEFPRTFEDELDLFKIHKMPLLYWPKLDDSKKLLDYLKANYFDVYHIYCEYIKSNGWLEKKWINLYNYLGLNGTSTPIIKDFKTNSLAADLIRQRKNWYTEYVKYLRNYFMHRLHFSPSFNTNQIHGIIVNMQEKRKSSIEDDSGFLNIAGNRLLLVIEEVKKNPENTDVSVHDITESIKEGDVKDEFKLLMLPKKEAMKIMEEDGELDGMSSSGDAMFDQDTESDASEELPNRLDEFGNDTEEYSNRPVSNEMMRNKGIVKYRHKRERNPRVHMKYKYKKAKMRQRSRMPQVKNQDKPYAGELTGINVNDRSYKFK